MSMTESEAIRMTEREAMEMFIKLLDVPNEMMVKYDSVLTEEKYRELVKIRCAEEMAITALSEIQQYRAIGTVEELRELKEKATAVCIWEDESRHVVCGHGQVEYRHKVRDWSFCPYCGMRVNVGDWSEGEE